MNSGFLNNRYFANLPHRSNQLWPDVARELQGHHLDLDLSGTYEHLVGKSNDVFLVSARQPSTK
jgi:hypothetical protein